MSDFLTHEEVTQLLQGGCPKLEAGYPFTKNQIAELEGLRNKVAEQAAVIEKLRSVLRFYIDHGICEPLYYKVKTALWLEIKLGEQATAFKTRIASLEAEVELLKAAVECFNAIEGYGDAHPNTTDLSQLNEQKLDEAFDKYASEFDTTAFVTVREAFSAGYLNNIAEQDAVIEKLSEALVRFFSEHETFGPLHWKFKAAEALAIPTDSKQVLQEWFDAQVCEPVYQWRRTAGDGRWRDSNKEEAYCRVDADYEARTLYRRKD